MLLYPQEHLASALCDGVQPRIRVERRLIRPAELREVAKYVFAERSLKRLFVCVLPRAEKLTRSFQQ